MSHLAITDRPGAQWFPKAGFGIFLHWGISSVDGYLDISWGMMKDYKWSPRSCPPGEYFALAKKFNPGRYDPEKWIVAAKAAGARYCVLTTRHHDSYALWPSAYGDFNTRIYMDGRDLVGEYVKACRKHGMKVGFYYSPPDFRTCGEYMDYNGWQPNRYAEIPPVLEQYSAAIAKGQIYELLTKYQPDLLWFDGGWQHLYKLEELLALQPDLVVGRGGGSHFESSECIIPTPEQYEQKFKGGWWEFCGELSNCWGYTRWDEYSIKPVERLAEWFTQIRTMGGNYLINVAPDSEGDFTPLEYERLAELGEFVKSHPELMPQWP